MLKAKKVFLIPNIENARRHAARILEMISGRRFHHEDKLGEADKLLNLPEAVMTTAH
jgi:hypothetical protein